MRFLVPLDENAGLRSRLSYHFGRAPFMAVLEVDDGQVKYEVKPNPADRPGGACGVLDIMDRFSADAIIAKRVGIKAAKRLLESGVEVYEATSDTLEGVIEEVRSGNLRPLDLASLASGICLEAMAEGPSFYPPGPPPPMPPPMPYPPTAPPIGPAPIRRPVPGPSGRLRVAVPTNGRMGLDDTVAPRFARCPTFTLIDLEGGRVVNVEVRDNPYMTYPHGAGFAVAQFLANLGVNVVLAPMIGPNAQQALSSLGIRVQLVPAGMKVRDALRSITG